MDVSQAVLLHLPKVLTSQVGKPAAAAIVSAVSAPMQKLWLANGVH